MKSILTILIIIFSAVSFFGYNSFAKKQEIMPSQNALPMGEDMEGLKVATFAGGCFWCVESDFEEIEGVKEALSGYTGGEKMNPTYKEVSMGGTGHTEAVQVYYNPMIVSYDDLLDVFWQHINPTDSQGQFVDRGKQYRAEIFYHNEVQKKKAMASKKALVESNVFDKPIVTSITKFETFYPAEAYHQNYYKKNSIRYKYYRAGSGRDQFLKKAWKNKTLKKKSISMKSWSKPNEMEIKKKLTQLQYNVTQKNGTEQPFNNEYWDNKQAGLYVDIVSGEPLFSSKDKYVSGTGWPSFVRALQPDHVIEKSDKSVFMNRIEVRSKYADSHLGHLFNDGPQPTGLRYCINSASLRFIPEEKLKDEGYEQYLEMVDLKE